MGCALGRKHTRIKLKARHLEDAKLRIGIPLQKRSEHFQGNTLSTSNSNVWMKGLEIRIETSMQHCILNSPMQRKKMRMPFSHTGPNHRRAFPRSEDADTAQGQ